MIHCVKKTLEDDDLEFVALSYRWGELHETLIYTGVGYTASVTSFALDDFYELCYMMTLEPDLTDIKYMWVDAICVDQRPSKRKAIIYQMSNIYERATYILAVPDLHLTYLKEISIKNNEIIQGAKKYCVYIYHLIDGNSSQLAAMEKEFLDDANIPSNPPEIRSLLLKYTDHFAHAFMNLEYHMDYYCPMRSLDYVYESTSHHDHWRNWIKRISSSSIKKTMGGLHKCHETVCPLQLFSQKDNTTTWEQREEFNTSHWKSRSLKEAPVYDNRWNF